CPCGPGCTCSHLISDTVQPCQCPGGCCPGGSCSMGGCQGGQCFGGQCFGGQCQGGQCFGGSCPSVQCGGGCPSGQCGGGLRAPSISPADEANEGSPADFGSQTATVGNVQLLDFSSTWCGPCQQMAPIVDQLERAGYAIRRIDVDQEKD